MLATFLRTEGKTLIVFGKEPSSLTSGTRLWRALRSTLTSSLGPAQLRLAVSRAVASEAIKANAVADFYDDHILSTQISGEGAVTCLDCYLQLQRFLVLSGAFSVQLKQSRPSTNSVHTYGQPSYFGAFLCNLMSIKNCKVLDLLVIFWLVRS